MKKISNKLIFLLVSAAIIPMLLYGIVSIWTSRNAAITTITEGNLRVAKRASSEIGLYVSNSEVILKSLAENISRADLADWQKERVIKNYVLNFREFKEIHLADVKGNIIVSSKPAPFSPPLTKGREGGFSGRSSNPFLSSKMEQALKISLRGYVFRSQVFISPNLIPVMVMSTPFYSLNKITGILVAVINLVDMWNLVDEIRIGETGYTYVVSSDGVLIAHGKGDEKARVLRHEKFDGLEIVKKALGGKSFSSIYINKSGEKVFGVATPVTQTGWVVVIEQPAKEALEATRLMTFHLIGLIGLTLFIMIFLGIKGSQKIVEPLKELMKGTRELAKGILNYRVKVNTDDEFKELGDAFNSMAGELTELQEEIKRKERSATFGKIAAGLVHDLKHPIKTIENSSRLIEKKLGDPEYIKTFRKVVDREFSNINRFLDDLYNLTHQTKLITIKLDVANELREAIESFKDEADKRNISINLLISSGVLKMLGDKFALQRVFKNIISNAIDAISQKGELKIIASEVLKESGDEGKKNVSIAFIDNGCGIPLERLNVLFTEYITTKRKGLGLGLAISKKTINELGGNIEVDSKEGIGTTFTVTLPAEEQ